MKKLWIILFLLLIANLFVYSFENDPSWIVFEKAKLAYRNGDLGQALRLFTVVNEKEGMNPEADFWIAKIFKAEGEYELAEKQFLKAYDNRKQLYIQNQAVEILYELKNLYKIKKNFKKYENTLLKITETVMKANKKLDENIERTFIKKGLDQLIILYRINDYSLIQANTDLGVFYFNSGRYKIASKYNLKAILSILSLSIEEIRKMKTDYKFEDLNDFISLALENDSLKMYFKETELFKNIYYLGLITYFNGNQNLSKDIFSNCFFNEAGIWQKKAKYYYNNLNEIKKINPVN